MDETLKGNSAPKEVDLAKATPLEGATNRNTIFLNASGDVLYKAHNAREVQNYAIIDEYRDALARRGVIFPKLVHTKTLDTSPDTYVGLSRIPNFHAFDIAEHFGHSYESIAPSTSFSMYLDALDAIQDVIPASRFDDADDETLDTVLLFVKNTYELVQRHISTITNVHELTELFEQSQERIEHLPRVTQHKDANPSNWRALRTKDDFVVSLVDLETLGRARRGWDEGRAYVLTCADSQKQQMHLDLISRRAFYQNPDHQIYFWRVVLFRALRELYLLGRNKYRAPLEEYERSHPGTDIRLKITSGLRRTMLQAIKELRDRL